MLQQVQRINSKAGLNGSMKDNKDNKKAKLNLVPYREFCDFAGSLLDAEMDKKGLSALSAAAQLDKRFGIAKQTSYTRILQMKKLHDLGKDPNITIKHLCAVLDAFGLQLTIKRKKKSR